MEKGLSLPEEYTALIADYLASLKAFFKDRLYSVCVFGSVARGEAGSSSDIDVLVVAEGLPEDVGMRVREINSIHGGIRGRVGYRLLRELGRSPLISDILCTPGEVKRHPPILLDITEDGIILYDKDSFLARELQVVRERLRSLGAKRLQGKGRYWVLKPDAKPGEVLEI